MDICAGVVEDCLSVCTRRSSNVPPTYRGGGVVVFLFENVAPRARHETVGDTLACGRFDERRS